MTTGDRRLINAKHLLYCYMHAQVTLFPGDNGLLCVYASTAVLCFTVCQLRPIHFRYNIEFSLILLTESLFTLLHVANL